MRSRSYLPFLVLAGALVALPLAAEVPMKDNAFIGSEACYDCHEITDLHMEFNVHMRIDSFEVQGREVGCEGCHGPGKLHMEEGDPELIRTFAAEEGYGNDVCMDCHGTRNRNFEHGLSEWPASTHAMEQVECQACHTMHVEVTPDPNKQCVACHPDTVALMQLPSHHPVREGKMKCTSCHNPHNSREFMLKTRMRKADLCYTCHQAIEGPWVFEHAPVEEDCAICHNPHGSVANNLLVANEPTLCLQCHDFHFHSGYKPPEDEEVDIGGFERHNPFGNQGMNIAFTTSCTGCHSHIHGSDTPSQTTPSRGRGLIP